MNTINGNKGLFNLEYMNDCIVEVANQHKLKDTLKALDFATKAHSGQKRKNSNIPYIYHPLNVACHAIALNIKDDSVIAACLLHDVVEDCDVNINNLPVSKKTKMFVSLLTHPEKVNNTIYYNNISTNIDASFIKLLDRCNNLTTMSWGMSKANIKKYIFETEKYIIPLLEIIRKKYTNIEFLLSYQIKTLLDVYKRLLNC